MSDYYSILGVSKDASVDDIKNAFKKLARINHPDKGGDTEKFQKIQEAYETLSDPNKRAAYDNPNPDVNNLFPFGFDHSFFRHHRKQEQQQIIKKQDHFYTCKITLREVFTGVKRKLRVQRTKICKVCIDKCSACNGNGIIVQHMQMGPFTQVIQQTCNVCNGSGKTSNRGKYCDTCKGNGDISEEKIFEIDIYRGIEDGKRFVFDEWGEQPVKDNERAGAFVVIVAIEQDSFFKRNANNLHCVVSLSFAESIVGKMVNIPHFSGDFNIDTRGFGLINPNKEYIVYDKGLVDANGKSGHLVIKFVIEYVERTFDDYDINVLSEAFKKVGLLKT
jgi:DnaJ-class molecular chaperone